MKGNKYGHIIIWMVRGGDSHVKVRGATVGVIHYVCESAHNTVACTNKLTTTGAAESTLLVVRLKDGCRIADTRVQRAQRG